MTVARPTKKQVGYLEILLNDCGFSTRVQRNAYLSRMALREIKYLDELTLGEASRLIEILKARREEQKPKVSEEDEEDM